MTRSCWIITPGTHVRQGIEVSVEKRAGMSVAGLPSVIGALEQQVLYEHEEISA